MKRILTLALLGTALATSSAMAATVLTFTDLQSFRAGTGVGGARITEDFNNNTSQFTTFDLAPGFVGGARSSLVTKTYTETITLNTGSMMAFSGSWDLSKSGGQGAGLMLKITFVDGTEQWVTLSSGPSAGSVAVLGHNVGNSSTPFFFGFSSDKAFTKVSLVWGGLGGFTEQTFDLDDLEIVEAVPEPSSFGLMGAAMIGLALVRRTRTRRLL